MNQQKDNLQSQILSGELLTRVGAMMLAATAMIVATEKLQYMQYAAEPVVSAVHASAGQGGDDEDDEESEHKADDRSLRKTVRAHEDYDVGLRMPYISGR